MKDISGLIRLEREDGPYSINPDYRLYVVIDSEKISVKKIIIPLEDILKEMRKKINKHYDEIDSLAARINDVKPEVIERDSIKGFDYHVPTLIERGVSVDIDKLDRKKHELILNYKLWDAPFSIHDVFSPKFGFDGALGAYVDLLVAKKKGEQYMPSQIKFEGTLKQMIELWAYLNPDVEMVYKNHINVRELQILGRKEFMFTKAKEDGLVTDDYKLAEKGKDYLKEILPKINVKLFASYPFIGRMEKTLDVNEFLYEVVIRAPLTGLSQKEAGDVIRKIALTNNLVPDEVYLGIAAYVMNEGLAGGYIKQKNEQIRIIDKEVVSTINKISSGIK